MQFKKRVGRIGLQSRTVPAQVVFGLKIPPSALSADYQAGRKKRRRKRPGVLSLRYPDDDQEILKCLADVFGVPVSVLVGWMINSSRQDLMNQLFPDVKEGWRLAGLPPEVRADLRSQLRAVLDRRSYYTQSSGGN